MSSAATQGYVEVKNKDEVQKSRCDGPRAIKHLDSLSDFVFFYFDFALRLSRMLSQLSTFALPRAVSLCFLSHPYGCPPLCSPPLAIQFCATGR